MVDLLQIAVWGRIRCMVVMYNNVKPVVCLKLLLDSGNTLFQVRPGDLADKCIAKLYLLFPVVERLNRQSFYEIEVVICFLEKKTNRKQISGFELLNRW